MRAQGLTPRKIADVLNAEKVLTPNDYRLSKTGATSVTSSWHLWNTSVLRTLLDNPAYIYSSTTKKALDELEERKRNLEIELFEAQTRNPVLTKEQILFVLYNFRKIDISTQEGKQRLIDGFVNSIYLYDDHFVITYNYKGHSKTVTFEELNSSPLTSKGSPRKRRGFCLSFFVVTLFRRKRTGRNAGYSRA